MMLKKLGSRTSPNFRDRVDKAVIEGKNSSNCKFSLYGVIFNSRRLVKRLINLKSGV